MEALITNYKINLKNITITLIGLFIILFIIWLRIIRKIKAKSIFELSNTLSGKCVIILFIFFFLLIIVLSILKIKEINYVFKTSIFQNKFILFFVNIYINYIKNSPKYVYKNYIFEYFNVAILIEKPLYKIIKLFAGKKKTFIYLLSNTFPKIIIVIIFLCDVYYYQQFHLFFKSLILLAIPLCANIYRYMAEDLADLNIHFFGSHLDILTTDDPDKMAIVFKKEIPNIEGAFDIINNANDTSLLEWFAYHYDVYTNIKSFCIKLNKVEDQIKPYENLFIYSCYLIGWFYILVYSLT